MIYILFFAAFSTDHEATRPASPVISFGKEDFQHTYLGDVIAPSKQPFHIVVADGQRMFLAQGIAVAQNFGDKNQQIMSTWKVL